MDRSIKQAFTLGGRIFALCDDGTLWRFNEGLTETNRNLPDWPTRVIEPASWIQLPGIPKDL